MMKKIAIVYASHDGHTQRISERIQAQLALKGHDAQLIHVEQFHASLIAEYGYIVFGSPIRYGKHLPEMVSFLMKHQGSLSSEKTAFFSVNLTARKPHRSTPETSNYIKKLFTALSWRPQLTEVFAGKLDYSLYRFFDKNMIRFIMWVTNGPTNPDAVVDYTNWKQVDVFTQRIIDEL